MLSCRSTAEAHLFSGDLVQRVFSVLQDGGRIVLVSDFVVEECKPSSTRNRSVPVGFLFCFVCQKPLARLLEGESRGEGKRKMGEKKGEKGEEKRRKLTVLVPVDFLSLLFFSSALFSLFFPLCLSFSRSGSRGCYETKSTFCAGRG